jgi:toxin YqcG
VAVPHGQTTRPGVDAPSPRPTSKAGDGNVKELRPLLIPPFNSPAPTFGRKSVGAAEGPVFRGDVNFGSQFNSKAIRKAYINDAADLFPANPAGVYNGRDVSVGEHILGGFRRGAKANSPFTSFTPNGQLATSYGPNTVVVDLDGLRKAIASGEVQGVEILDNGAVLGAIRNDPSLSDYWKTLALKWAIRDQDILIKGTVPGRFIKAGKQ